MGPHRKMRGGAGADTEAKCVDVFPELTELIKNCAWLKDLNCTDILNMASFWPPINETDDLCKNMFNFQVKKLVVHIAAQIKLKRAIQDPTSMIGEIAKQMTVDDHILCQCQGLETYDVLNAIHTYDKTKSFEINMDTITKAQQYKPTTSNLLIQKLNNVFQYEFGLSEKMKYCFAPVKPKQWHNFLTHLAPNLVPRRFPQAQGPLTQELQTGFFYEKSTNLDFESIERDAFSAIINTQQRLTPQDITTETAHTAVVVVTTHGQYVCSEPKNDSQQDIATYTIPRGKTLTIVSVATPTIVDINGYLAIKQDLIDPLRKLVYELNVKNQFINPITTAQKYLDFVVRLKRFYRRALQTNMVKHVVYDSDKYMANYTDPRAVAFNEFDVCIDKEYSFHDGPAHETQVLKLNFSGWDQELLPRCCCNYTLSRMCDFLFNVENHKNILVFDFSCSVTPQIIGEKATIIKDRALELHLNGGHKLK
jgi:hypothetical protein